MQLDPQHLKKILNKLEQNSIKTDQKLLDEINKVRTEIRANGFASMKQQHKEFVAMQYKEAASYSNIVMIGGYASAFAIWQLTKDFMTPFQTLTIGLLLTSSIMIFAAAEVYSMVNRGIYFRRANRVIEKNVSEAERIEAFQTCNTNFNATQASLWLFFFIPSVTFAFGAGIYLIFIFITQMIVPY